MVYSKIKNIDFCLSLVSATHGKNITQEKIIHKHIFFFFSVGNGFCVWLGVVSFWVGGSVFILVVKFFWLIETV